MLPLLACDQIQLFESYIGDDVSLHQEYVSFLNNLVGQEEYTFGETVIIQGLMVKDPLKLQHKTLIKMAEKVVKKYNLNLDDYPAIFTAKNVAGLCYLVRQKVKEERSSAAKESYCQKWDQLIETFLTFSSL